MEGIVIRDMTGEDLPQVHSLEEQMEDVPWSMNSFSYEVNNNDSVLLVAVWNAQVVGYLCIRSILDTAHLMKINVMQRYRKRGIATGLITTALERLRKRTEKIRNVTLEVRESNTAAITLYKNAGFVACGRRRNYYRSPAEDALIMTRNM